MSDLPPSQPRMLAFVKDLPNICSLAGLFCAVLGLYYSIIGNFPVTMIAILWAVLFDWYDGIIARRMKGRIEQYRVFGGNLDSMIDIVSFGICPAVILLSYGKFNPWFLPGAFVIIAISAIRLSYFNVYGLVAGETYIGLPLDNNVIILAFLFLLDGVIGQTAFSIIIYVALMLLGALNLSSIRMPKPTGRWVYIVTTYVVGMTIIYSWILWCRS